MELEEEYICNRCGFGSDELDEGEIAADCFAQLAHEMYCNSCIADYMNGDWVPARPDDSVPTIGDDSKVLFASGGWCTPTDKTYNPLDLYSYSPMYFGQKRSDLFTITGDTA